ncbi:MAG: type II toxin-antitoxin system RelE/ParE family toxin [Chloroflexi bacterium]|nr:type II toxin-antitoxin system RelE/ParE family toxin [Chloroflexota bacterium]
MARIIWTPESLENLESIADYLLEVAPSTTRPLLSRIVDSMDDLAAFPRMGRPVPGLDREDLRERIVDGYRVIYHITGEYIWVLCVRHGSTNVEAWLRSRGF